MKRIELVTLSITGALVVTFLANRELPFAYIALLPALAGLFTAAFRIARPTTVRAPNLDEKDLPILLAFWGALLVALVLVVWPR